MKKAGKVVLGVTIAVVGVCIMANGFSGTSNTSSQAQETEAETGNTFATLDKFNQIENGMTYSDVVEIVGCDGTVMSESEVSDVETTLYYWYGEDGISNMNVMIQNDSVISKAQVGLK